MGFECFIVARLLVDAVTVVHVSALTPCCPGPAPRQTLCWDAGTGAEWRVRQEAAGLVLCRDFPRTRGSLDPILSACLPPHALSVCATREGRGRKRPCSSTPASVSAERDGPWTLKAVGEQVWLPRGAWRKAFHWRDPEGARLTYRDLKMGFPSPDHSSLLADVEWTLAWGPGPVACAVGTCVARWTAPFCFCLPS